MKNKVAIIGKGYVGSAYYDFFKDSFDTIFFDPAKEGSATKEQVNQAELAVICVPTNMREDGSCDTSIVDDVLTWLDTPLVLIKSAVEPGTTDKLNNLLGKQNICVSPEYIGEGKYFVPFWKYPHPTDAKMHDFFIIGGPEPARGKIVDMVMKVAGPSLRVTKMTATEAEIVKYTENAWGAMKVTFANEIKSICDAYEADFHTVREGWVADGRVERMHTMVREGARGYKSKCFDKDIPAFIKAAERKGYEAKLLKQVVDSNEDFKALNNHD